MKYLKNGFQLLLFFRNLGEMAKEGMCMDPHGSLRFHVLRNGYTLVTEGPRVDCALGPVSMAGCGMPPNFGYGMVTLWLRKGPVSMAKCLQTLVTEWLHFGYGRVPSRLRNACKLWLRNGYALVTEGSRVECGMPANFGYGMVTLRLRKGPVSIAERL